jgi:spermidine synthase
MGLGAGTLASYARTGDVFRYYEINPQVEDMARREFSFVADSPGKIEIQLGDGRLLLERESRQNYDLLVIDVFSGDSVPLHFLTIEAMQLYFKHLRPDGIIAYNVSNLYLNLAPVIEKAARQLGKYSMVVVNQEDARNLVYQAEWVLVAADASILNSPALRKAGTPIAAQPGLRLWTDNYSNLLQVIP